MVIRKINKIILKIFFYCESNIGSLLLVIANTITKRFQFLFSTFRVQNKENKIGIKKINLLIMVNLDVSGRNIVGFWVSLTLSASSDPAPASPIGFPLGARGPISDRLR